MSLKEAIKRNLRNRANNDDIRYVAEGKLLQQEYNADLEDRFLQERPDLLNQKLTREAEYRNKRSLLEDQQMEEYLRKNPDVLDKIVERELLEDERKQAAKNKRLQMRDERQQQRLPPPPAGVVPALEQLVTPATKETRRRGRARGNDLFEPDYKMPPAPKSKATPRYSPIHEVDDFEDEPVIAKPKAQRAGAAARDYVEEEDDDEYRRSYTRAMDAVRRAYPSKTLRERQELARQLAREGRI